MANYAIATQILNDGPRNTVAKVTGDFLGASPPGQTTIITASLLTSMLPGFAGSFPPTLLRIDHIDYSITDGVIVQLLWNATTDVPIVELYGRGKIASHHYGGLQNNAGAGVTGNIDLAINASAASFPTDVSILLILHMVKNRAGGA
jgi:hypothetical protein